MNRLLVQEMAAAGTPVLINVSFLQFTPDIFVKCSVLAGPSAGICVRYAESCIARKGEPLSRQ